MNKRARNRLIIGAVIIVVIGAAGLMLSLTSSLPIQNVNGLLDQGDKAIGERTKVVGFVIGSSWNGKGNPMRFEIADETSASAEPRTLKVLYTGPAPSGFGDKTKATLTGVMGKDGVFTATDMLTVCPTKYQTAAGLSVDELLADKAIPGTTVKVSGYVNGPAEGDSFTMTSRADGGGELKINSVSGLPDGIGKGAFVELTGVLQKDGTFSATKVQVNKKAK